LGEGILYEALNMASKWKAPILFVLENNHIAQTTNIELSIAGGISDRFKAFGIPSVHLNTSDVLEISSTTKELVSSIRNQLSPYALILDTNRFGPHSKGDDTRDPDQIKYLKENYDPIQIQSKRMSHEEKIKSNQKSMKK
jgi:TPP-dependent pyruvate/acetoin dehydrogenase alpha subunit